MAFPYDEGLNTIIEIPFGFEQVNVKEYIGIHMDEGFRVKSTFCRTGQHSLSFELAYFLDEIDAHDYEKIFYLGSAPLKGVWENNFYPILWYSGYRKASIERIPYSLRDNDILIQKFINSGQIVQSIDDMQYGNDSPVALSLKQKLELLIKHNLKLKLNDRIKKIKEYLDKNK